MIASSELCAGVPAVDSMGRQLPDWLHRFYVAYLSAEPELLHSVLHDDVRCLISGPVDQFDLFGFRSGKAAMIELITRIIPCYFHFSGYEFEHVLVDDGRVAVYGRVRAKQRESGRPIGFRFAHWLQFRDGKLLSFRVMADTFDAAEQMVGHSIDVTKELEGAPIVPDEELSEA